MSTTLRLVPPLPAVATCRFCGAHVQGPDLALWLLDNVCPECAPLHCAAELELLTSRLVATTCRRLTGHTLEELVDEYERHSYIPTFRFDWHDDQDLERWILAEIYDLSMSAAGYDARCHRLGSYTAPEPRRGAHP